MHASIEKNIPGLDIQFAVIYLEKQLIWELWIFEYYTIAPPPSHYIIDKLMPVGECQSEGKI